MPAVNQKPVILGVAIESPLAPGTPVPRLFSLDTYRVTVFVDDLGEGDLAYADVVFDGTLSTLTRDRAGDFEGTITPRHRDEYSTVETCTRSVVVRVFDVGGRCGSSTLEVVVAPDEAGSDYILNNVANDMIISAGYLRSCHMNATYSVGGVAHSVDCVAISAVDTVFAILYNGSEADAIANEITYERILADGGRAILLGGLTYGEAGPLLYSLGPSDFPSGRYLPE